MVTPSLSAAVLNLYNNSGSMFADTLICLCSICNLLSDIICSYNIIILLSCQEPLTNGFSGSMIILSYATEGMGNEIYHRDDRRESGNWCV